MVDLWSFLLKGDITNFITVNDVFLQFLFFLLLKEILLLRVNFANVLVTIHIFFWFIKTKLIVVSEVVEDSFIFEVY